MDAIVYTSNAGTTAEYAALLGRHTGLPVFSLKEAKGKVATDAEIIYLGWVMASMVMGYDKAIKQYRVKAVCGVCMGATGTQLKEIREGNSIPGETAVFSMRGGFSINKLHGIYKLMMKIMIKTSGKSLAEKSDRTEDENIMLEMMLHGGNYVSEDNLNDALEWYNASVQKA